jgi:hypothetical protein
VLAVEVLGHQVIQVLLLLQVQQTLVAGVAVAR